MVFCRCVHPLAPVQTPDVHGGNGVIAALTARPRVAGKRDPVRRPMPDGQPETWAVPRGWGRPFDRPWGPEKPAGRLCDHGSRRKPQGFFIT